MDCIALVRCVLVLRCGLTVVVWYPCAGWGTSVSLHTQCCQRVQFFWDHLRKNKLCTKLAFFRRLDKTVGVYDTNLDRKGLKKAFEILCIVCSSPFASHILGNRSDAVSSAAGWHIVRPACVPPPGVSFRPDHYRATAVKLRHSSSVCER